MERIRAFLSVEDRLAYYVWSCQSHRGKSSPPPPAQLAALCKPTEHEIELYVAHRSIYANTHVLRLVLDDPAYEDLRDRSVSLVDAVKHPNRAAAMEILKHSEIIERDEQARGYFVAVEEGRHDVLECLPDKMSAYPPDWPDHFLFVACECGNTELVRKLLEQGVDPQNNRGDSLAIAVLNDHFDVVELLLSGGRFPLGCPAVLEALEIACENGLASVVELLLAHYTTSPSACVHHPNLLRVALTSKHWEVVQLLLECDPRASLIQVPLLVERLRTTVEAEDKDLVKLMIGECGPYEWNYEALETCMLKKDMDFFRLLVTHVKWTNDQWENAMEAAQFLQNSEMIHSIQQFCHRQRLPQQEAPPRVSFVAIRKEQQQQQAAQAAALTTGSNDNTSGNTSTSLTPATKPRQSFASLIHRSWLNNNTDSNQANSNLLAAAQPSLTLRSPRSMATAPPTANQQRSRRATFTRRRSAQKEEVASPPTSGRRRATFIAPQRSGAQLLAVPGLDLSSLNAASASAASNDRISSMHSRHRTSIRGSHITVGLADTRAAVKTFDIEQEEEEGDQAFAADANRLLKRDAHPSDQTTDTSVDHDDTNDKHSNDIESSTDGMDDRDDSQADQQFELGDHVEFPPSEEDGEGTPVVRRGRVSGQRTGDDGQAVVIVTLDTGDHVELEDGMDVRKIQVRRQHNQTDSPSSDTFQEGNVVEIRYQGRNIYYPGAVIRCHDHDIYDVRYDDGEVEYDVKAAYIRVLVVESERSASPLGCMNEGEEGEDDQYDEDEEDAVEAIVASARDVLEQATAQSQEPYQVGDRVEVLYGGGSEYYKGHVVVVVENGTYDVEYDDGDHEDHVEPALMRRSVDTTATTTTEAVTEEATEVADAAKQPSEQPSAIETVSVAHSQDVESTSHAEPTISVNARDVIGDVSQEQRHDDPAAIQADVQPNNEQEVPHEEPPSDKEAESSVSELSKPAEPKKPKLGRHVVLPEPVLMAQDADSDNDDEDLMVTHVVPILVTEERNDTEQQSVTDATSGEATVVEQEPTFARELDTTTELEQPLYLKQEKRRTLKLLQQRSSLTTSIAPTTPRHSGASVPRQTPRASTANRRSGRQTPGTAGGAASPRTTLSWREMEEWRNVDLILSRKRRIHHGGQRGSLESARVPWGEEFAAIQSLKRFVAQHPDILRAHIDEQLQEVMKHSGTHQRNAEFANAARDALLLVKDLSFLLQARLAPFFGVILPVLLPAVFDADKRFLSETAHDVLDTLVLHCKGKKLTTAFLHHALKGHQRDDAPLCNLATLYVEKCLCTMAEGDVKAFASKSSVLLETLATLLASKSVATKISVQKSLQRIRLCIGDDGFERIAYARLPAVLVGTVLRSVTSDWRCPVLSPKKYAAGGGVLPPNPGGGLVQNGLSILQRMVAQRQNKVAPTHDG